MLSILSLTQVRRSDRLTKAATSLSVAEFDAAVVEVARLRRLSSDTKLVR